MHIVLIFHIGNFAFHLYLFHASQPMHLILCIVSYTSYHMPHILYASDFMHPILCSQLYTFLYMLYVLFSTFELLLKLVAHGPTDGPTDGQTDIVM